MLTLVGLPRTRVVEVRDEAHAALSAPLTLALHDLHGATLGGG